MMTRLFGFHLTGNQSFKEVMDVLKIVLQDKIKGGLEGRETGCTHPCGEEEDQQWQAQTEGKRGDHCEMWTKRTYVLSVKEGISAMELPASKGVGVDKVVVGPCMPRK